MNQLGLLFLLLLSNSFASTPPSAFDIRALGILPLNSSQGRVFELRFSIQDKEPHPGVCPYYVKKLNYEKFNLSIDLQKDFCPNDQFGKSQGSVAWSLPSSLIKSQSTICIEVNGIKSGSVQFLNEGPLLTEGCN